MIEIADVEDYPPNSAGWYIYTFANGFQCHMYYNGTQWKTAGGQMHRIMPGDTWHSSYFARQKTANILEIVWRTSRKIKDGRTPQDVLAKSMEELGELSQEVLIAADKHYKDPGNDGIVGEAIDVMICMADMIYGQFPDIPECVVAEIMERKLIKWEEKSSKSSSKTKS